MEKCDWQDYPQEPKKKIQKNQIKPTVAKKGTTAQSNIGKKFFTALKNKAKNGKRMKINAKATSKFLFFFVDSLDIRKVVE